jgi:hypothetical protein
MKNPFCTPATLLILSLAIPPVHGEGITVRIDSPVAPPEWALLERELLRANTEACREFFSRYFDERGYLACVERWGGDDGPDDAIENCNDWPLLHALGASDEIRAMYRKAWEGHLRQYTEAKTVEVPFARDGMYYKEFPVMFDWQHNNEGLLVFHLMGLSEPESESYDRRLRRYAGFYMNEDPGAPNYDPRHKVIRSLFNGSRGPLLRKATALDWTGDPIEVEHRFGLGHGERSYEEMLAHFRDYNDIVGDHPLNLLATSLALNAYMVNGDVKYRTWLLEYVDAWRQRMINNNNIIPSNIGLDGTIGGECDGKWYGGAYGWGFSVVVPQTGGVAHRNRTYWGFTGFMNAYLLTGDDRYLDVWRKQRDTINAQSRTIDGQDLYPRMHGDQGWYHHVPEKYAYNNREIYFLSMKAEDRKQLPDTGWMAYLDGTNPTYPEQSLRADLMAIGRTVAAMRKDGTTPDTRLADDPMRFNPARVGALRELMQAGIYSGKHSSVLHSRLRYFDPVARRAGVPQDVAALVEKISADEVTFQLVNVSQIEPRELVVQAGAYAEHQLTSVSINGESHKVESPNFTVVLEPGCGVRITAVMKRYVNQPTLQFPW